MSRYIDVNELQENICKRVNNPAIRGWLNALINDISVADMQEIVRCKDCKYFLDKQRKNHQGICMCGEKDTSYAAEFYPYADDFCSYGERKDEG